MSQIAYEQEVKAVAEVSKQAAKDLATILAQLGKLFFNSYKGKITDKQANDLVNKGETQDFVNVKIEGKDGYQQAVLVLNKKLVKELQKGDTTNLTENNLKKDLLLKFPFSQNKEPYLGKLEQYVTPEQIAELKANKEIKGPVSIDFGKGANDYFVGINPNTNEIRLTNAKYINVPKEFKGATLDKDALLAGKTQEAKILSGDKTLDASIFFCPKTGKLKALTDNDTRSVALDTTMNVTKTKYFEIKAGDRTFVVNVDDFAKHNAAGSIENKSIAEFLNLKDKFGDKQFSVSSSNLRQWELAAPADKLVLNVIDQGKNYLIPYPEYNAQKNYKTAKEEGITQKAESVSLKPLVNSVANTDTTLAKPTVTAAIKTKAETAKKEATQKTDVAKVAKADMQPEKKETKKKGIGR